MKRLLIFLSLFLLLAGSTHAESSSDEVDSSSSGRVQPTITRDHSGLKQGSEQKTNQTSTDRISKGIDRGIKEIDRRIDSLTKLIDEINNMKKLSDTSKSTFTSQIQAEIDSLNNLKTKIQADTDIDTLKSDLQSVVKDYRIYVLYLPKMRILVAADRLGQTADKLSIYSVTLSTKISEAKTAGKDTTSQEQLISDMNTQIASARDMFQKAVALVTPLTPELSDYKTPLMDAQTDIKTGSKDLKTAFNDAIQIRRSLGGEKQGSEGSRNVEKQGSENSNNEDKQGSESSRFKISPLKK